MCGIYAALTSSVLFLCAPSDGYASITECKFTVFTTLFTVWIAVMAAGGVAALMLKGRPAKPLSPAATSVAAGVFLLLCAVSALLSPYGGEVLIGGTRYDGLIPTAMYVISFILLSGHLRADGRLLSLFAAAVSASCIISLMQFAGFDPFDLYPNDYTYAGANIDYDGIYTGTLGNADLLCGVLAAAAAAFITAALKGRTARRFLYLIPAALALTVIFETGVSGAVVALACFVPLSLPVFAGKSKKRRRAFAAVAAFIIIAALAFLWFGNFDGGTLHEISEALHGRALPEFGSGRMAIWTAALSAAGDNLLLGTGPDTFRFLALRFEWTNVDGTVGISNITAAHNEYLNILVSTGLLSLIAYLAMLAILAVKWYHKSENPAVAVAGAFVLTYAIQAFFGISMPVNAPYFWFFLAALNAERHAPRLPE